MDTYLRFLQEFLSQFFSGFILVFKSILEGVKNLFNIPEYIKIVAAYKKDFSGGEWVGVGVAILTIIVIVVLIGILLAILIRRFLRIRKLYSLAGLEEHRAKENSNRKRAGLNLSKKQKIGKASLPMERSTSSKPYQK